jgi:hypothetical protein
MTRLGVWLLLLPLLTGCASSNQDNSPEAVCRRQAYDDPAVKGLLVRSLGENAANAQEQFDYEMDLRKATDACLRRKGVQVRGGVEPVGPH